MCAEFGGSATVVVVVVVGNIKPVLAERARENQREKERIKRRQVR